MSKSINREYLKVLIDEELQNDMDLLDKLFSFFERHLNDFKNIDVNIHNLIDITNQSHRLKSSCRSMGALSLAENLQNLETAARANEVEKVKNLYSVCLEEVKTVLIEAKEIKVEYNLNGTE